MGMQVNTREREDAVRICDYLRIRICQFGSRSRNHGYSTAFPFFLMRAGIAMENYFASHSLRIRSLGFLARPIPSACAANVNRLVSLKEQPVCAGRGDYLVCNHRGASKKFM